MGFVALPSDVSAVAGVAGVAVVSPLFSKIAFFSRIAPRNSNEGLFQTADHSRVQELLANGLDELLLLELLAIRPQRGQCLNGHNLSPFEGRSTDSRPAS